MKAIKQSQSRDITDAYDREDISYSKMNEMLNSLADNHAILFSEWLMEKCDYRSHCVWEYQGDEYTQKQLL